MHLASAKLQITSLTDEIAQKFEDNVRQQEEITQLISMVVELQSRQKQVKFRVFSHFNTFKPLSFNPT